MGGFVLLDLEETLPHSGVKPCVREISGVEHVQATGIKSILKVFQIQGKLQNLGI